MTIVIPAVEIEAVWWQYHVALDYSKGSQLLLAMCEWFFWNGMTATDE